MGFLLLWEKHGEDWGVKQLAPSASGPVPQSAFALLTICVSHVALGKLHHLSMPQFLHLQNGKMI